MGQLVGGDALAARVPRARHGTRRRGTEELRLIDLTKREEQRGACVETDAHAAWVESIAVAARETTTALGLSSNAQ